ncbi:MAG: DNA internalization-related competence protein ComEC/Rec2 [Oscillospiraceae bacterium]|nr:DNA internalization-related competence protein ComEC/Rec2 [Oscillospiraceae bacterium]
MVTIKKSHIIAGLAATALAIAWWLCYTALFYAPAEALDGEKGEFTVTVSGYSESYGDSGSSVPVSVKREGVSIRGRLVFYNEYIELSPGDVVTTRATAHLGTRTSGEFLRLYSYSAPELRRYNGVAIQYLPQIIAHRLSEIAGRIFPEDVAPLMKAVLIGDRSDWFKDAYTSGTFKRAGLAHVVAVSGMHLAYLAGLISIIFGKGRLRSVVGIPIIVLFVLVTGATPSVVRAGVMTIVFLVSQAVDRNYAPWRAMLMSLGVLYLLNPFAVFSTSAVLSYSSAAGIFLFERRLRVGSKSGFIGKIRGATSMVLAANVLTFPLSAVLFGEVSIVFLPANLLALGAVAGLFVTGIGALILGCIWEPIGRVFGGVFAWFGRYLLGIGRVFGGGKYTILSISSVYVSAWIVYITISAWILLALKKLRRRALIFTGIFLLSLTLTQAFIFWGRSDSMSVTALDVGQGQSIIFTSRDFSMVVDCGGDRLENEGDLAANFLASTGVYSIDVLALTHFHRDHAGGAATLLRRVDVKRLIVPLLSGDEIAELADEILAVAEERGTTVEFVTELTRLEFGESAVTIYPPLGGEGANERGLMLLAQAGNGFAAFISGDADSESELRVTEFAELPPVNLFIAGHHGSKGSNSMRLLSELMPQTVIISVGEQNGYGLPDEEAIERFAAVGARVYRTDENGTVTAE